MSNKGLGELKKYLPRGYGEVLVQKYGCSKSKIYKVVAGKLTDYKILQSMKEMAEENIEIVKQIERTNRKLKTTQNDSNI